jgi:hypothetical protein
MHFGRVAVRGATEKPESRRQGVRLVQWIWPFNAPSPEGQTRNGTTS